MILEIQLDAFEGPLDLLLHLITKDEIDIYDIPIVTITSQYLDIIEKQSLDLERTSEFLLMAATLLEIKSKMLLPNHAYDERIYEYDGVDPREELVKRLLNYKKYKHAAEKLQALEGTLDDIVFREQEELSLYIPVKDKTIEMLETTLIEEALARVVQRMKRFDEQRSGFFKTIKRDLFTVEEKINVIMARVSLGESIHFDTLLGEDHTKEEVVVTFLALLELLKLGRVVIKQTEIFGPITIERTDANES